MSYLTLFVPLMIYCCMLTGVPAALSGGILGLLLHIWNQKRSLTPLKGVITGIVLAGMAGILSIAIVILIGLYGAHGKYFRLLAEIENGYFFTHFFDYVRDFITVGTRYGVEVLASISIACLMGGLTGLVITKQILAVKQPHQSEFIHSQEPTL